MIEYGRLPTVRVKRADGRGFRLINATDYDPQRHELAERQELPATELATRVNRRGRPRKHPKD